MRVDGVDAGREGGVFTFQGELNGTTYLEFAGVAFGNGKFQFEWRDLGQVGYDGGGGGVGAYTDLS